MPCKEYNLDGEGCVSNRVPNAEHCARYKFKDSDGATWWETRGVTEAEKANMLSKPNEFMELTLCDTDNW